MTTLSFQSIGETSAPASSPTGSTSAPASSPTGSTSAPAPSSPSDPGLFGWANYSLPPGASGSWPPSSCLRYTNTSSSSCQAASFTNTTASCSSYVFSKREMRSSLATEWGLVCAEDWRLPLTQSVFFGGVLVGAVVWGPLGDLWGRRTAFLLAMLQTALCGLAAGLAPSLTVYTVLMFFTAMGQVLLHLLWNDLLLLPSR